MCRYCVVACARGAMCPRRAWTAGPLPAHPWLARPPPCTLTTMSGASARPATRLPRRQRPPPGTPPGRPGGAWWTASAARSTRRRTRRLRAAHPPLRPPPRHLQLPAPRLLPWDPILHSHCTSRPSAMIPSRESSGTPSKAGVTHRMHPVPSSISIPPRRLTTICLSKGNANLRYLSGRQVEENINLTLMVAIKVFHSPVGIIPTARHAGTSRCPTSVEMNVERLSQRLLVSPTTPMACETTRRNQSPAPHTHHRVLYLVSSLLSPNVVFI